MRTFAQWLALHESVHPKAIDMDLSRVTAVAQALALTEPAFRVITVAGTNGKGSTVAHADALLRALGAATGMFTSPHFVRYNERIRVGGAEVGDAELIAAFERIEAARGATTLTFFEFNTLAALSIFAARGVDVAVLEVGLGGRLDATNLLAADVAVLTSVGLDHCDFLGDTLDLIGAEKAGIFRARRPAVLGTPEMPPSVFARIAALPARALIAGRDFSWQVEEGGWRYRGLGVTLDGLPAPRLAGSIQYRNAATALAAVEALGLPAALSTGRVGAALADVRLAGRMQIVPGPVEWVLDIAHNEPAARVLAGHLRERPPPAPGGRTFAVVGVLADKDAGAIGAAVAGCIDAWIVCALPGPRGRSAAGLARSLGLAEADLQLADSVEAGCTIAAGRSRPGDRVVVFGSVYTVGPALQWLRIY